MTVVILKAHFDGKSIALDEPYELQPGTPVTVTVFPSQSDLERSDFTEAALNALSRAYGDDEPEYSLEDIKR